MILAAGRGNRMGGLTQNLPKPLLKIKGKTLLEYHLEKLANAGFQKIVINISYLAEMIKEFVGDGSKWNLDVTFSEENPVLETAGGIKKALSLLGTDAFIVINADIYTNYQFEKLKNIKLDKNVNGYLVLVKNPQHNLAGDFGLLENNFLTLNGISLYTFSGIAIYNPILFDIVGVGEYMHLAPLLKASISKGLLKGGMFEGIWSDIGAPERLRALSKVNINKENKI